MLEEDNIDLKRHGLRLATLKSSLLTILNTVQCANLNNVFPNVRAASLTVEDCLKPLTDAIDWLHKSDQTAQLNVDEAAAYKILCIPAANSSPDWSNNKKALESLFATQLCEEYQGDAPLCLIKFVANIQDHFTILNLDTTPLDMDSRDQQLDRFCFT